MELCDVFSVFLDASGAIVWTSGVEDRWRGAPLVGQKVWSFCIDEDKPLVEEAIRRAVKENEVSCYTSIAITPQGDRQGWLGRVCPTGAAIQAKGIAACLITSPIAWGQAHLTGTEIQVLRKLARLASIYEVAKEMSLADVDLRTHLTSCKAKLQLETNEQLREYALKYT